MPLWYKIHVLNSSKVHSPAKLQVIKKKKSCKKETAFNVDHLVLDQVTKKSPVAHITGEKRYYLLQGKTET